MHSAEDFSPQGIEVLCIAGFQASGHRGVDLEVIGCGLGILKAAIIMEAIFFNY